MDRRGLLSSIVLVFWFAGCSDVDPTNGPNDESEETPDERAEIVDHELVREAVGTDEEQVAIEGTVRITEDGLQHVELRGQFFDADGESLDTTFERLRELELGTQPFAVEFPEIGPVAAAVEGYDIRITTVV